MAPLAAEQPLNRHKIRFNVLASACLAIGLAACQTQPVMPVDSDTDATKPANSDETLISQRARTSTAPEALDGPGNPAEDMATQYTNLWDRIRDGFQLQAEYSHPGVKKQIRQHSANQRLFDLVSLRATPFLFYIVEEIENRGLPLELALLPIVESTYNPNAYSPDHAVGLWQMIGPTATSFGVQQDWWFDGRRDPLVSTNAALDYLEALYASFGNNWLVAIGAYNTGGGNMRRAMRRGDQTYADLDFWSLPVALETQSLVPKLLAFAAIVNDIANHEIELPVIDNKAALAAVELPGQIDLAQAAMLLDIEYDDLRGFNPGYLQWATHPDGPQLLMVPPTKAEAFRSQIAAMDPAALITWDRYKIKSGDTLSAIATKLGTRTDVLMTINELKSSRIIVGNSLLIPRNIHSVDDLANYDLNLALSAKPPSRVPTRYTIRRGDNLWRIARSFNLRSLEIAKWNNFAVDATLRPGQVLDLSFARDALNLATEEPELANSQVSMYRVNRGDTIEKIAKRYQHSVSELLQWNSLSKTELIFPGQKIRLTPPDAGIN